MRDFVERNRGPSPCYRSDFRGWRYLLDELLADTGSGHNVVATVYLEANPMYRDRGPEEMRPVGEVEFANGVAAMCDSGSSVRPG
jgi:L-fuconolactonase